MHYLFYVQEMAPKAGANVCVQVEDVRNAPSSLLPTILRRSLWCNHFYFYFLKNRAVHSLYLPGGYLDLNMAVTYMSTPPWLEED